MRLVVFHYHDRPGGVRQVISQGLPALVARLGGVEEVVLLLGEVTDAAWGRELAGGLAGVRLRIVVHPEFGYRSGQPQMIREEARAILDKVLSGEGTLCWAHNLSVGRNLPLLRLLPSFARAAGARLWLHHHDWWWDGRWARWRDWQAAGIQDLEEALEISLPDGRHIHHWCVNRADLPWVRQRAGNAATWVGNPLPDPHLPDSNAIRQAAAWLREKAEGRRVWLAPVRALRRKNLAEAILLASASAEPAVVVTTGGPSSPGEVPAWEQICQAANRHRWRFVPAVLSPGNRGVPPLAALMAAADAIMMPSLQEGFGLPYLEAAALNQPLLARALPDVRTNLAALGCTLPSAYATVPVSLDPAMARAESRRRAALWQTVGKSLPGALRMEPDAGGDGVVRDFGQLTLSGQLDCLGSGRGLAGPVLEPQVPCWPPLSRVDGWVDRFFATDPGGQHVRASDDSLLPEVFRRFRHWQRYPLLWP